MTRLISFFILVVIISVPLFSQGLTVTGRTPDVNVQNVDASTDIEVVFDKNINAATVDENTFNVDGLYTGKITGAYTVTGKTVIFSPDNDFRPGEVITVTITTELQANDASVLVDGISWQFSVESLVSKKVFTGQEVISTSADGAYSVFSVDLDGDGDMDVLSASTWDDKIAWYKNDGDANFTPYTITTTANGAQSVFSADLDGDGDMDVLSASLYDNKIAWYENNGNENFTEHAITTSAVYAACVFSVDLDGDGDMDVLSASFDDDKVAWYENDGDENFNEHIITTSNDRPLSVFSVDLDGDGDMDILCAASFDHKIVWYENDGDENFVEHTITTSARYAQSVFSVDLDGDGDMDVLSASSGDDKIAWYENDGSEVFSPHTITTSADDASSVSSADLDGDGDMDVLSTSDDDNKIAWYENDGDENFSAHTITTSARGARFTFSVDLDGDGDIDVLSASYTDDKIAWYENISLGVSSNFTSSCEKNNDILYPLASFPYQEDIQFNPMTGLQVKNLPNKGYLYFDDNSDGIAQQIELLMPDAVLTTSELDENKLKYKPFTDEYGTGYSTFTFKVENKDGFSVRTYTATINVDNTNSSPTAANGSVTSDEDTQKVFDSSEFNYSDIDNDVMQQVLITKTVLRGELYNDTDLDNVIDAGELIVDNVVITKADIDAEQLKFVPVENTNGSSYTVFSYRVHDGTVYSESEYVLVINITAIDDPPIATNGEVTTDEDVSCKFAVVDFNFSDVDGHRFDGIKVTELPVKGTLLYDGNNIAAGDEASVVSKLVFKPSPDEFGTPYTIFKFMVKDESGAFSVSEYTMTINVNSVEDPNVIPVVITNSGCTVSEGGIFTFSDTVLSARDGDDPTYSIIYNILKSPIHGSLALNGSLFKTETFSFTQNDIANGKVTYTHNGDESETDVFRFTVSDDKGGSSPEYNFDITIVGANEPPVVDSLPTIRFNEDEEYFLDLKTWYEFVHDVDTPDSSLSFSFSCDNDCIHFSEIENRVCTITSDENYFGIDTVCVTISDGEYDCTCKALLTIESVNDLPVISGLPVTSTIDNGSLIEMDIALNIEDIETPDSLLTIGFISDPDSIYKSYDVETGKLYLGAIGDYSGEVELTIFVIDEDFGTAMETIIVYVHPNLTATEEINKLPDNINLSQNYPNPFNPSTVIRYSIPVAGTQHAVSVQLRVYDTLGNEVATLQDGQQSPGFYERTWHAGNLSSGIYFYVLRVGSFVESKKMILLK